jgi:hypothetical protein
LAWPDRCNKGSCATVGIVRRLLTSAGLLLLAGAVPACLLYTDPINSPPKVTMTAPAVVYPGKRDIFQAQGSDPDGDAVTVEWSLIDGKCPPICSSNWGPEPPTTGDTFEILPMNHQPFCVRVRAVDEHGATSTPKCYEVTPQNHPPVPTLSVDPPMGAGSFPLYTDFRISAGPLQDEDLDTVTFKWTALDPQGADISAGLAACDSAHRNVRCLSADQPGSYSVSVEASDGLTTVPPISLALPVLEDAPPCIEATDPAQDTPVVVLAATDRRDFEVRRVRDDGNPFPPGPHGGTTFQWFTAREGSTSWTRHLGFDQPLFEVSAALFEDARPGSAYQVRVEARDPQHDTGSDLRDCGEAPICMVPDKCVRWVTWSVRFQ